MTDDVDIAMKYADERKLRLEQTKRLHSLMFEVIPYLSVVDKLISIILCGTPENQKKTAEKISEIIKDLTIWGADIKVNLAFNVVRPVGLDAFLGDKCIDQTAGFFERTTKNQQLTNLRDYLAKAARQTQHDWKTVANTSSLPSLRTARTQAKHRLLRHIKTETLN